MAGRTGFVTRLGLLAATGTGVFGACGGVARESNAPAHNEAGSGGSAGRGSGGTPATGGSWLVAGGGTTYGTGAESGVTDGCWYRPPPADDPLPECAASRCLLASAPLEAGGAGGAGPSCRFEIPDPPAGETLDLRLLNLVFESPDAQFILAFADGSHPCADLQAWTLDDPDSPSFIVLCPASCDLLRREPGRLWLNFGCPYLPLP